MYGGKKNRDGLQKLLENIFIHKKYNSLVRPFETDDRTHVRTELKLLQIDLV